MGLCIIFKRRCVVGVAVRVASFFGFFGLFGVFLFGLFISSSLVCEAYWIRIWG